MRRLAVGLWLLVGGVSVVAGQGRDDFHWSRALAPGKTLEIVGISGDVDARGGSGREAVVTAVKRARHSDPEDVRIEVVEHADGVTICAVYPSWRDSRRNECLPGGRGHHETHDNDVKVHFTVTVPRGIVFVGRTVNGGVEATGLEGAAEVHSVNGSVTLETSSYGSATTVNGSVHARLGQADWDDEVEFTTVNGGIELTLPSGTDADLKAHTVNGGLEADFPVTVRGKWGPKRIQGTIGRGGRSLTLSTVNGSMEIRRAN